MLMPERAYFHILTYYDIIAYMRAKINRYFKKFTKFFFAQIALADFNSKQTILSVVLSSL